MTIVAIHQPNFFPWLGFFDKIIRADRFVLLDHVQMPLTGSSYCNRVSILMGEKPGFMQIPVTRGSEARTTISGAPIASPPKGREKLLRTVQQSYAKAPFSREVLPVIETLILNPASTIGAYNEQGIRVISERLGVARSKLISSSDLTTNGTSTALLIAIVKAIGGDTYMAGGGAAGYQEDVMFSAAGVKLIYQNFRHPIYPQHGQDEFVPGLSIIDALMNLGFDGTAAMLHSLPQA
ncbi:MAG: WbqC family protein [Bacteroidota bacterium]|nr:WbqC family protein [Bacteroidota bacterium]